MTPDNPIWRGDSKLGVAATGSAESAAAAIEILRAGGNAMDAATAAILALVVTDHGECSIGGEAPVLLYDASERQVRVLCGQGRAPLSPEAIAWYMKHGIPNNDIKMAPVPSVLDLCFTMLSQYGTCSFAQVVRPTLALLSAGTEAWQPKLARTLHRLVAEEQRTPGDRIEKLQAACDRFYGRNPHRRDIADELVADYRSKGGFLGCEDLAAHRTTIEAPVTVDYRGYTVCKCGPWTQGPCLCQALRLLEGFDVKAMGRLSADHVHVATEAMKLAMADRDTYYADPEFVNVPLEALLSDAYTGIRRPLIDMTSASQEARPGDPYNLQPLKPGGAFEPWDGGTTTCVVADRWGNVVAATPSANVPAQARDGGAAGVTYSNRLRSLNTTPGHPNCIAPGKRPRITLTPTLVLKEGKPVMAVSVAGGDLQDQATLSLLLDVIDFELPVADAVSAPRFATKHHQDSFDPNPDRQAAFIAPGSLVINAGIDDAVLQNLRRRGHRIAIVDEPIARPVMLMIDHDRGILTAAGDPAAGRHVSVL